MPDILQHIVGHANGSEEPCDEEDETAPDEDYVIGGTGVVKALGVCLGNLNQDGSDALGTSQRQPVVLRLPDAASLEALLAKRPRDMSKNLLESARNIGARIQSALIREDRAGNDANYRELGKLFEPVRCHI